ncbi:MAG: 5-formyltetrahydrofolate cyclo-ligase [Pseudomonadota bacterium]
MLPAMSLVNWKATFRERSKAARRDAATRQPNAARFAATHFMTALEPGEGDNVAIYHAIGDELDTAPLAGELARRGVAVLLPVVVKKKEPLRFRLFEIDKPLEAGAFGILEPRNDAPEMVPNIVVTPLLAVRPDGARLGMGGGFYDRTLESLRNDNGVTAIGYGYQGQMLDRFPVGPTDQFLDGFVSEAGYQAFQRRR